MNTRILMKRMVFGWLAAMVVSTGAMNVLGADKNQPDFILILTMRRGVPNELLMAHTTVQIMAPLSSLRGAGASLKNAEPFSPTGENS